MGKFHSHVLLIMITTLMGDAYCRQNRQVHLGASRELLGAAALSPLNTFTPAYNSLLAGLAGRNYSRSALVSTYIIWAERGFPVIIGPGYPTRPVVAAVQLPSTSRLVAVGHEGIVNECCSINDEWATLLGNAFKWLANAQSNPTNSTIRIGTAAAGVGNLGDMQQSLSRATLSPVALEWIDLDAFVASGGSDIDILWIDTYIEYTPAQITAVLRFANQTGKGIMVAGHAWNWAAAHPGANIFVDLSVNKILWPLGLAITTDFRNGFQPAPATPPADWLWYSAYNSLSAISSAAQTGSNPLSPEAALLVRSTIDQLLSVLPPRSQSAASGLTPTWSLLDKLRRASANASVAIGPQNPFSPAAASLVQWFQMKLGDWTIRRGEVAGLLPSPSAALYPGALPPNTLTVTVTATVNGTYNPPDYHFGYAGWGSPVWQSTGLYAPPGTVITVTVRTAAALNKGLKIQIGAHTDDLTGRDPWKRVPYIVSQIPVANASSFQIGNPMGGLIFVLVPAGLSLGNIQFSFRGVVRAPYFKLGQNVATWASTVRNYAAPWAELDSGKFVLMLPSAAVRGIDNPTPLLNHWNKVMDSMAFLANITTTRPRAERFLVDADINYAWMHSGYPIMAYDVPEVLDEVTNLQSLQTKGAWNPYSQLGHNHQWAEMIFSDGCIDSLHNLFTIYALEKTVGVNNVNIENWSNISPAARATARAAYLAAGAKWSTDWNAWIALDTYLQLREGFGWTFYRRLYTAYQQMSSQLPDNLVDTWIQTSCRTAGVNLVPFYTKWGFPIGESSKAVCGGLPRWTTDPMNPTRGA